MRLLATCLFVLWTPMALAQAKPQSVTPAPRPDEWWQKRHESFVAQSKAGNIDVAFLGDSITQGWEGEGKEAWKKTFAPLKAGNYGISGDQTQHVLWRITEGKELEGIEPKVAVIMIGTNNFGRDSAADVAIGIESIVKELRRQHKAIKVLVLGIFPRGPANKAKDGKIAAADIDPKSRDVNARVAKLADDKHVFFLDINEAFLNDDGSLSGDVMPDYLHLSPKGYEIWASAIEGKLKELLGAK